MVNRQDEQDPLFAPCMLVAIADSGMAADKSIVFSALFIKDQISNLG